MPPESSSAVDVVLWDADGVLQRVPHEWEESMRPAVEGRGLDVTAFLDEAFAAERPALTGEVRWLDVLPALLARWGIGDALDEVLAVWLSIEEVPAVRPLVEKVRSAGVRCALATNQDEPRASYMRVQLGYDELMDATFWSYELGVAKPDPAYFTAVLDRLAVPASRVLFFDDNEANVVAARSVGLHAKTWSYREDVDVLRDHLRRHGLPA